MPSHSPATVRPPYRFSDWRSGKPLPKGWDCADAIEDLWTKDDIDAFMRATVKPWTPPADERQGVSGDSADAAALPAGDMAVGVERTGPVIQLRPVQQDAEPEPETNIFQITGVTRFDYELESWLSTKRWAVRRNLLTDQLEIHRPAGIVPLSDERLSEIRFTFQHASNGKEPAKDKVADALALIGERRAYHPVRDYLASLEWDGVERLNSWLTRYAGAAETALHSAMGRKMLCAAVRRALHPGSKFDHILVLQGQQDLGKSSLIRALCHDPLWFSDQAKVGADAKETIERTSGAWLVELAELDGLGRREGNAVKSFVTTVSDKARPAYARYTVERPRQFVLFGTTNERTFLNDLTGNRRWWLVTVTACDVPGLSVIRDQLWAEAVVAEPDEKLWLDTAKLKAAAAAVTDDAIDHGPWYDILAGELTGDAIKVAVVDAWKMVGIEPDAINKISPVHRASLRRAMAGLGFDPEPRNVRRDGKQTYAYIRGNADAPWWPAAKVNSRSSGLDDPW
jgi:hypothetical protein